MLLVVASAAVYALGLAIAKSGSERAKQAYMAIGVAAVVAVIVAFKAAGAWRGLLLPLGVSYYSFKLISYLIEVYWDDEAVERDPVVFFLFPAFFPQIVSGPIQRPEPFFAQIREVMGRTLDADQLDAGFRLILGGLMMKLLVGDRLAAFIELVDTSHADYSYSVMLTTSRCYMLQLYADFAGYTNIALGVGKLFGIDGPPNFHAPFAAVNMQEFWRRWHMSLTSWVTDYLFTPLSMSLRGLGQIGLDLMHHAEHADHRLVARLHAQLSGVRRVAGHTRLRHRAHRDEPQDATDGLKATRSGASLAWRVGRHDPDFHAAEPFHDLLAFGDLGEAISILKQVLALSPSGSIGWSDMPASLTVPAWICMAIALFVGVGAPGAKRLRRPARHGCAGVAAIWRLPLLAIGLVYGGVRPIRLRAILIGW